MKADTSASSPAPSFTGKTETLPASRGRCRPSLLPWVSPRPEVGLVRRDLLCLISPLRNQCQGPAWSLDREGKGLGLVLTAGAAGVPPQDGEPDSELYNFASPSVCPDIASKTLLPAQSPVPCWLAGLFHRTGPLPCAQPCPSHGAASPSRGSTRHLCQQWGLRRQKEAGVQGVLGCWLGVTGCGDNWLAVWLCLS